MRSLAVLVLVGCVALVGGGCYSFKSQVDDLVAVKVKAFEEKNGRNPSTEEYAALVREAEAEERERRKRDLEEAGKDASGALGAVLSGNWITALLLGAGSLATVIGLRRSSGSAPTQPPSPPSPPAVVAGEAPAANPGGGAA